MNKDLDTRYFEDNMVTLELSLLVTYGTMERSSRNPSRVTATFRLIEDDIADLLSLALRASQGCRQSLTSLHRGRYHSLLSDERQSQERNG
jgi:hypothetical protein